MTTTTTTTTTTTQRNGQPSVTIPVPSAPAQAPPGGGGGGGGGGGTTKDVTDAIQPIVAQPSNDAAASASAAAAPASTSHQIGKRRPPFMFAGILGSVFGSFFFSVSMLMIKMLPDHGSGLAEKTKIVGFRGLSLMIFSSCTLLYQRTSFLVPREELFINVTRSLLGFAGVFGSYTSLKYISMGDSTALVFSSPVWTSLLSYFILNEPLQWIQLVALPLSIFGIVLIAHPSLLVNMEQKASPTAQQPPIDEFIEAIMKNTSLVSSTTTGAPDTDAATNSSEPFDYEHRWKGIAIALATSIIVSFVYIVLKFRKITPIQTTTFWLGTTTLTGSLAISCFVGFGKFPEDAREWLLIAFNGIFSWFGQCLLQWGLKYEDASVLSVVRTLDVAMTFTLSSLFLPDEKIPWTSVLGASIIAAVVISIMLNYYLSYRLCPPSPPAIVQQVVGADGAALDDAAASATVLRSSVTLSTGEGSGELELGSIGAGGGHGHGRLSAATCCGSSRATKKVGASASP